MADLGNQNHDARLDGQIEDLTLKAKLADDWREAHLKLTGRQRIGGREGNPHEEAVGASIAVLSTFNDIAVLIGDRIGHSGDNAFAIIARQRQHEARCRRPAFIDR
jgi:hypothetical protein